MNREDLYQTIGQADERLLERSQRNRYRRQPSWWMRAAAAVLIAAVAVSGWLYASNPSFFTTAYAINEAVYPQMASYPDQMSPFFEQQFDAWQSSVQAQKQPSGYANGLENFFESSIRQTLSGEEGENKVYAPLSAYMTLGMLAELTGGESRGQILSLLGTDSIEALRSQAYAVWNGQYRNDGATTCILANSVWLNEGISFIPETMERLADTYYASSYQGEMGSDGFHKALQGWLDEQTGGLLKEQTQNAAFDAETVLALASAMHYQAKWANGFSKENTTPDVFHSLSGDMTCDFMHSQGQETYYWAEQFGAVAQPLENGGGTMWFILPDEGVRVQELLQTDELMEFLRSNGKWENRKTLKINLSVPKFDISSQTDLREVFKSLGVTDVFDQKTADFSAMTNMKDIFVSKASHGVRVAIDEEGVTAAAYTAMYFAGAAPPPEDEMDFVLDRPFLFVVTSDDGLPLFAGSVYRPE